MIDAVVFDLDGVLIDSEQMWDRARREVADQNGGTWKPDATAAMQGMSSTEWANYMHDVLGVALNDDQINESVVANLLSRYSEALPLLRGATAAVGRVAAQWPLGLASSSNRGVIETVLELSGLRSKFAVVVSSEEVQRGKPYPDIYLEAARLLGIAASRCSAVEDSTNGIRSAAAAGMVVIAIPDRKFPPTQEALSLARTVLPSLDGLTVDVIRRHGESEAEHMEARLDEQEDESFPSSDPHADWAGPPT